MNAVIIMISIIIIIIFTLIAVFYLLYIATNNSRVSNGIVNYDIFARRFVYKVPLSKEEVIYKLSFRNAKDEMMYVFDQDNSEITFYFNEVKIGGCVKYRVVIDSLDGSCIMHIEQISNFNKGQIPFKMNLFWLRKLGAEAIPYYGNEVSSK